MRSNGTTILLANGMVNHAAPFSAPMQGHSVVVDVGLRCAILSTVLVVDFRLNMLCM